MEEERAENINVYVEDKPLKKEKKRKGKQEKNGTSRKWGVNTLLAFVAYIGIGCIAIALLLTLIFKGNTKVSDAFSAVGQVIAYIICICLAFSWVKSHRKIVWIVCYVVFVVTIIVLFILNV